MGRLVTAVLPIPRDGLTQGPGPRPSPQTAMPSGITIKYMFYKNWVLYMCQFWYAIFNYFSGGPFWDEVTFILYSVVFTSVPVVCSLP